MQRCEQSLELRIANCELRTDAAAATGDMKHVRKREREGAPGKRRRATARPVTPAEAFSFVLRGHVRAAIDLGAPHELAVSFLHFHSHPSLIHTLLIYSFTVLQFQLFSTT